MPFEFQLRLSNFYGLQYCTSIVHSISTVVRAKMCTVHSSNFFFHKKRGSDVSKFRSVSCEVHRSTTPIRAGEVLSDMLDFFVTVIIDEGKDQCSHSMEHCCTTCKTRQCIFVVREPQSSKSLKMACDVDFQIQYIPD